MPTVLAVAHDAGSANALSPVARWLRAQPDTSVRLAASGPAVAIWRRERLAPLVVEAPAHEAAAAALLASVSPDALLLGTAWDAGLEHRLLRHAPELPSVAVLDMWSHYRHRWTDPRTGELSVPTVIAVPDARAAEEGAAEGLPADRLAVTGQPYLDRVRQQARQPATRRRAQALRRRWRPRAGQRIVVFASQPHAEGYAGSPHDPGYTELDALELLIDALRRLRGAPEVAVLVKSHPAQRGRPLRIGPRAARFGVRAVGAVEAWPCLLAADLVVGMESMLLVEASLLARPTLSLQPGADRDRFIGSRVGAVPRATTAAEATAHLRRLLAQETAPSSAWDEAAPGNAAPRIGRLVLELAAAPSVA